MKDAVGPRDAPLHERFIEHRTLDQFKSAVRGPVLLQKVRDVGAAACRKIVDSGNTVAVVDKTFAKVAADEPGAARNQGVEHHV
jgi:hypothetical protein